MKKKKRGFFYGHDSFDSFDLYKLYYNNGIFKKPCVVVSPSIICHIVCHKDSMKSLCASGCFTEYYLTH